MKEVVKISLCSVLTILIGAKLGYEMGLVQAEKNFKNQIKASKFSIINQVQDVMDRGCK